MQHAITTAEEGRFQVETSDLPRNDADDHAQGPLVDRRGKTDRFLLKLTTPAE